MAKGDAADRAHREKVYRAVHAAIEKGLRANPDMTVEAAIQRRQLLRLTISRIESEYIPAVDPAPATGPDTAPEPEVRVEAPQPASTDNAAARPSGQSAPPQAPGVAASPREAPSAPANGTLPRQRAVPEPSVEVEPRMSEASRAGGRPGVDVGAEPGARRKPRSRGFAAMFLGVTVLAAVGIGVWWAAETGLLLTAEQRDTAVRNPPPVLDGEDFDPATGPAGPDVTQARGNWITIFTPSDPTLVTAPTGATAEVLSDEDGAALKITSGNADAPVLFDVGQGILDQIAGRHVLFDVTASAEDGQPTQISVTCNLGELGDCGRNRYNLGIERGEFLFDIRLPDGSPGAAGTIAIVSDVDNDGKAALIHEIRVSVAE